MTTLRSVLKGAAALLVLGGCAAPGDARNPDRSDTGLAAAPPPVHVDSARPMAEMIDRFRSGLPRPDSLAHAAPSADALVARLVTALAEWDSLSLPRLLISRAEYAWLYFPENRLARPPYELDPDIAWMSKLNESHKGINRAFRDYAGRGLKYLRHQCRDSVTEGRSQIWSGCTVTVRLAGGDSTLSLFHSIVAIDGRYKFFSYGNRL